MDRQHTNNRSNSAGIRGKLSASSLHHGLKKVGTWLVSSVLLSGIPLLLYYIFCWIYGTNGRYGLEGYAAFFMGITVPVLAEYKLSGLKDIAFCNVLWNVLLVLFCVFLMLYGVICHQSFVNDQMEAEELEAYMACIKLLGGGIFGITLIFQWMGGYHAG